MNRREFLRLTGLVTLPVAVPMLSSCTGKKKGGTASPSPTTTAAAPTTGSAEGSIQSIVNAAPLRADSQDAQPETLLGSDRVAFGLFKDNAPILGATVTVYAGLDVDQPPVATTRASWIQGELAPRGLYVAKLKFPTAGAWLVGIKAQTKDGKVFGSGYSVLGGVLATSPSPIPGQPAISVRTPTTADPAGANPLCSNTPPCSMHAISLDKALTNGKPTVFTVAAPAYCTSEMCGPVVRLIDAQAKKAAGKANFVHLEAYDKDHLPPGGGLVAPAAAWHFTSEPWTYFLDAKGIVADRLPGAFGEQELAEKVAKLLA